MPVPAKKHYTFKSLETDSELRVRSNCRWYLTGQELDDWAWANGRFQRKILEREA